MPIYSEVEYRTLNRISMQPNYISFFNVDDARECVYLHIYLTYMWSETGINTDRRDAYLTLLEQNSSIYIHIYASVIQKPDICTILI